MVADDVELGCVDGDAQKVLSVISARVVVVLIRSVGPLRRAMKQVEARLRYFIKRHYPFLMCKTVRRCCLIWRLVVEE